MQQQATIDASAAAQTIIALMEGRETVTAAPNELHELLTKEAERLHLDLKKDDTWPKSARKLWPRIKDVLPVLEAIGIAASYERKNTARAIILKRGRNYRHDRHATDSGAPAGKNGDDNGDDRDDTPAPSPHYRHAETAPRLESDDRDDRDDNSGPSSGALFGTDDYATPAGWVKCPACLQPFDGAGEATYCPACLGEDD